MPGFGGSGLGRRVASLATSLATQNRVTCNPSGLGGGGVGMIALRGGGQGNGDVRCQWHAPAPVGMGGAGGMVMLKECARPALHPCLPPNKHTLSRAPALHTCLLPSKRTRSCATAGAWVRKRPKTQVTSDPPTPYWGGGGGVATRNTGPYIYIHIYIYIYACMMYMHVSKYIYIYIQTYHKSSRAAKPNQTNRNQQMG